MPKYSCSTCSYSTNLKANFARHNKSIKHQNTLNKSHNNTQMPKKCQKVDSSCSLNGHSDLSFLTKSIRNEHSFFGCSKKNTIYGYNTVNSTQKYGASFRGNKSEMSDKTQNLSSQLNYLDKIIYNYNDKKKTKNQNIQSHKIKNTHNINNIHNDNSINTTTTNINSGNINSNNIMQQNVIVNNFGHGRDDWSHVTEKMYIDFLKKPYSMISAAFKLVNLNREVPQNHNIRIANRRSGKVLIWEGNMWNNSERDGAMTVVVDEKYYEIDGFFRNMMKNNPDRLKELMTKDEIDAYIKFAAKFDKEMDDSGLNDSDIQPLNAKFREDCFYKLVDILDNAKYNGEYFDFI